MKDLTANKGYGRLWLEASNVEDSFFYKELVMLIRNGWLDDLIDGIVGDPPDADTCGTPGA